MGNGHSTAWTLIRELECPRAERLIHHYLCPAAGSFSPVRGDFTSSKNGQILLEHVSLDIKRHCARDFQGPLVHSVLIVTV